MHARPSGSETREPWWGARGARLACALLALAFAGAPAVRADEESKTEKRAALRVPLAWRDKAVLTKRLNEACDAVERVCGAKFGKRPTVNVSDAETMKKLLAAEFEAMKALRDTDSAALAGLLAPNIAGFYEDDRHVVHVAPGNVEKLAALQGDKVAPGEDVLRILLVHEATHALDWERFPLESIHNDRETMDGALAVAAVSEGHAQWVAERVAAEWGLTRAFEELTRLIVSPPADLSEAQRQALAPILVTATFAYVNGLTFMKAVEKAKGRGGIESALRAPPASTRDIEEPARWLDGGSAPAATEREPDLGALLGDLRGLVGDSAWSVNTDRLLTAALRTQEGKLRPEDRKRFLDGYEDGRVAVGQIEGEDVMVIAMVLLFATPEQASVHVAIEGRTILAQKGEVSPGLEIVSTDMTPGAGPDGTLAGFAVRRELRSALSTILVQVQIAAIGRVVLEFVVANVPSLDRAAQDRFLARAALRVTDPDAAAKASALEPPVHVRTSSRALTVRIVGPDGKPVPRVRLEAESDSGAGVETDVHDGEETLTLPPKPGYRLFVWEARDEEGKPLPLAPRSRVRVDDDAREIEVRLEPGLEIAGKVVDDAGLPVARITVEARATLKEGNFTSYTHRVAGSAVTGPDGTFRLIGVDGGEYRLRLMRDGKEASIGETETRGGAVGVQVVLRPSRTFQVTVLDAGGAPVPNARVQVSQHGMRGPGAFAMGQTDSRGRVNLEGLDPAERARLEITPPDAAPTVGRFDRFGWEPKDEVIRLPMGRAIAVRVVDAEGRPARGRIIHRLNRGRRMFHTTDDEGRFTILHVAIGPARLAAVAAREEGPGQPDPAVGYDAPEWALVTPEQSEITLTVQTPRKPGDPKPPQDFDEDESPRGGRGWELVEEDVVEPPPVLVTLRVPDARVARTGWLRRVAPVTPGESGSEPPGPSHGFEVAADGSVKIAPLVPGNYEIWIPTTEEDERSAYLPLLELGKVAHEITLVPAMTVRFRLTLPSGSKVHDVDVIGPLGTLFHCVAGDDGVHEAAGLPPGTWRIHVRARAPDAWIYADVDAETGTEIEVEPKPKVR